MLKVWDLGFRVQGLGLSGLGPEGGRQPRAGRGGGRV